VTGLLEAFATIDKLQETIYQRDQSVVALVVENSKLRRQVEQIAGELSEVRAQLAWRVGR
jgi:phage shock protein A